MESPLEGFEIKKFNNSDLSREEIQALRDEFGDMLQESPHNLFIVWPNGTETHFMKWQTIPHKMIGSDGSKTVEGIPVRDFIQGLIQEHQDSARDDFPEAM